MGYTRYYNVNKVKVFDELFIKEVEDIISEAKEKHGVVIRGWDGTGEPTITQEEIRLNGDGDTGEECETFTISTKKPGFEFCKTREYPYDMVVSAIIKLAKKYGYINGSSSDGESFEEKNAKTLYRHVLERRKK